MWSLLDLGFDQRSMTQLKMPKMKKMTKMMMPKMKKMMMTKMKKMMKMTKMKMKMKMKMKKMKERKEKEEERVGVGRMFSITNQHLLRCHQSMTNYKMKMKMNDERSENNKERKKKNRENDSIIQHIFHTLKDSLSLSLFSSLSLLFLFLFLCVAFFFSSYTSFVCRSVCEYINKSLHCVSSSFSSLSVCSFLFDFGVF